MARSLLIARREAAGLFQQPLAYALLAIFHLLGGVYFMVGLVHGLDAPGPADLTAFHLRIGSLLVLVAAGLAGRGIGAEAREGTLELYLASGTSPESLVWGKFLGLSSLVAAIAVTSLLYPVFLAAFAPLDWGQVSAATLGLFLMGESTLAAGLFASALSESATAGFFLALGAGLLLWWGQSVMRMIGFTDPVMLGLGLLERFAPLARGVLDGFDVYFFLALVLIFNTATGRVVEARRW